MALQYQRAGSDLIDADPARLTEGARDDARLLLPLGEARTGPVRTMDAPLPKGVAGFQIATRDGENIQGDPDDPSGHPSFAILDWATATAVIEAHPERGDLALQIIFDGDVEEPIYVRAAA